jgi:hypothetical protein
MKNDPIIDELHRIRYEYAARFNFDLDALFHDLNQQQQQGGRAHVMRAPRLLNPEASIVRDQNKV